ncbi:unnamed protein product, partial [Staurois parvus]
MDPFMETNRYNVSTAVWKDSPRTVINSLFLTVSDIPSIQRLKQLYGVNVPELSEIDRNCHRTSPSFSSFSFFSSFFSSFFLILL